jgi:hypothetical protein
MAGREGDKNKEIYTQPKKIEILTPQLSIL